MAKYCSNCGNPTAEAGIATRVKIIAATNTDIIFFILYLQKTATPSKQGRLSILYKL